MLKHLFFRIFAALLLLGYAFAQQQNPRPDPANPDGADFTAEFYAGDGSTPEEYRAFIQNLRTRIRSQTTNIDGHDVCIAPQYPPRNFFDVVVRITNDVALRLRFLRHDVYLVGWRDEASPLGPWTELRRQGMPEIMIKGSTPVGFTGDYRSLEGAGTSGSKGKGTDRSKIPLNRRNLEDGVRRLREDKADPDGRAKAKAAISLIHSICEPIRFHPLEDEATEKYGKDDNDEAGPSKRWVPLTANWGKMSKEYHTAPRPINNDQPVRDRYPAEALINTIGDIIAIIALYLECRVATAKGGNMRARRDERWEALARRSNWDVAAHDTKTTKRQNPFLAPEGRELMEIYSMIMTNVEGDVYGTVTYDDGTITEGRDLTALYLHPMPNEGDRGVRKNQAVTLLGPQRAMSAADTVAVDIDLKVDAPQNKVLPNVIVDDPAALTIGTPLEDRVTDIGNDVLVWSSYTPGERDKVQTFRPQGSGNVDIKYVVMSNAAEAIVEIVLTNGDNESTANVYGTIEASTSSYKDDPRTKIQMFFRNEESPLDVAQGADIPLPRHAISVPMQDQLMIWAHLYDYDSFPPGNPSDEIASGTATFAPRVRQKQSENKSITGESGSIEVRVTWY